MDTHSDIKTDVESFFDPDTFTLTHLVTDPASGKCALIDSVLDFDPKSGRTSTKSADKALARIDARGLTLEWVLETHVHADHLTAGSYIREKTGAPIGIGANVRTVQDVFTGVFNLPGVATDGSQFDHLFADGEAISIGGLTGYAMYTPGHTPACATYVFGDAAFIGDTLFAPDYGSARCDFPGGDGEVLYNSIQKILALPDATRLFLCHDYQPGGRELMISNTVAEQRQQNVHLTTCKDAAAYAKMRADKDATLSMPVLILPSVQVNIRAGKLPEPEDNGTRYLKLPLDLL
ncbi:MAG: MBL fold metallo-hydrolase [Rhodospirillales bacterium]|nr:MBL fold metallo-hydrolase [Rhodospirillales bacterium]MBO6787257.1 MBL fold metallo-hydrolase [Rhodospirillales bacterium]